MQPTKIHYILLAFWLVKLVESFTSSSSTFQGCKLWTNKFRWECAEEYRRLGTGFNNHSSGKEISQVISSCNCHSPEFITTLINCVKRVSEDIEDYEEALKVLPKRCKEKRPELTTDLVEEIYNNGSHYFVDSTSFQNLTAAMGQVNYSPIRFTDAQVNFARKSYSAGYYVTYTGLLYGYVKY